MQFSDLIQGRFSLCSLGMAQEVGELFVMRYIPIRGPAPHYPRLQSRCLAGAGRNTLSLFDIEDLIRACAPDAATCDQGLWPTIRNWFDSFDDGIPDLASVVARATRSRSSVISAAVRRC